ncbi:MAG: hypothetical protein AAF654_03620 [Myxococcota bacterium]
MSVTLLVFIAELPHFELLSRDREVSCSSEVVLLEGVEVVGHGEPFQVHDNLIERPKQPMSDLRRLPTYVDEYPDRLERSSCLSIKSDQDLTFEQIVRQGFEQCPLAS